MSLKKHTFLRNCSGCFGVSGTLFMNSNIMRFYLLNESLNLLDFVLKFWEYARCSRIIIIIFAIFNSSGGSHLLTQIIGNISNLADWFQKNKNHLHLSTQAIGCSSLLSLKNFSFFFFLICNKIDFIQTFPQIIICHLIDPSPQIQSTN